MENQLIDEITKEVLRRLQTVELVSTGNKKSMLVLSEENRPLPDYITKEYHMITMDLTNTMEFEKLYDCIAFSNLILIASLSAKQLANLALGVGEGLFEEGVRCALLLGKPIFILEEGLDYRAHRKTAQKTYYRKLLEYEECIHGYGMRIIEKDSEIIHSRNKKTVVDIENKEVEKVDLVMDKKLILEKDLMALDNKIYKSICIGKSSIVTPSALDYARAHHIQFIKK